MVIKDKYFKLKNFMSEIHTQFKSVEQIYQTIE